MQNYSDAIKWIDSGLALSPQSEEDAFLHKELKEMQKTYAQYR